MKTLQRTITSVTFQRLINKKAFSAFLGWIANRKLPHCCLLRLIHAFVKSFQIDLAEYDFDPDSVQTFNDFFVRKLKPGARAIEGPVCSPADGFVSSFGTLQANQLIQVKGKRYRLNELVQNQPSIQKGSFLCIYLSLGDYHRVHLPFDATLLSIKKIPGTLYSLSPRSLETFDNVYCRNERIVLEGVSPLGSFYLILIGAIVVGKIKLNPSCTLHTPLLKGTEIGCFKMGSSVLLLLDSDIPFKTSLERHLKMGNALC